MSSRKNIVVTTLLGVVWVAALAFDGRVSFKYETTPGRPGVVSANWPSASVVPRTRLRQDKATRDIPVLVIIADATARQIKRLMAAGAQSDLTKPLDIGEFFRVIDETMRNRDPHQREAAVA